jgi:hypothetical protein
MLSKMDPDERILSEPTLVEQVNRIAEDLGWGLNDQIVVEIGGTVISGIHQGDDYNKKWATPYGVRKYNKDAFIVIKNQTRDPFEPSKPPEELKPGLTDPE